MDIVDIIDKLYKLSIVIRNPQLRNRTIKAEAFIGRDSESREISERFEQYAVIRARHQLCSWKNKTTLTKAEDQLAVRLGKANSRRRIQFMYDQRHYQKLAVFEYDDDDKIKPTPLIKEGTQVISIGIDNVPKTLERRLEKLSVSEAPTLLSGTTASKYIPPSEETFDTRSTISGSTTHSGYQMSDISIPEAPGDDLNKDFQCPYCKYVQISRPVLYLTSLLGYLILPAKTRNRPSWR